MRPWQETLKKIEHEYSLRDELHAAPEVAFLQYNSPYDTDILQEYFVPVARFVPLWMPCAQYC